MLQSRNQIGIYWQRHRGAKHEEKTIERLRHCDVVYKTENDLADILFVSS